MEQVEKIESFEDLLDRLWDDTLESWKMQYEIMAYFDNQVLSQNSSNDAVFKIFDQLSFGIYASLDAFDRIVKATPITPENADIYLSVSAQKRSELNGYYDSVMVKHERKDPQEEASKLFS